jgi:hypothetical protein
LDGGSPRGLVVSSRYGLAAAILRTAVPAIDRAALGRLTEAGSLRASFGGIIVRRHLFGRSLHFAGQWGPRPASGPKWARSVGLDTAIPEQGRCAPGAFSGLPSLPMPVALGTGSPRGRMILALPRDMNRSRDACVLVRVCVARAWAVPCLSIAGLAAGLVPLRGPFSTLEGLRTIKS